MCANVQTISARALASPGHSKSQSKGAKADLVKLPEMYAWVGPFACGKVILPDALTHAHMQTFTYANKPSSHKHTFTQQ